MLSVNKQKIRDNKISPIRFIVFLAGKSIEVHCNYEYMFKICKNYIINSNNIDFSISVSIDEIIVEAHDLSTVDMPRDILNTSVSISHPYEIVESQIIFNKITIKLIEYNIILLHGAAIAVDNKCYIFTARSGVGKTTHIKNWQKVVPNTIVVNGDKPYIDVEKKLVYGSPWCGKENLNTNISIPLSGIIYLERGINNEIIKISFHDIIPVLLQQIYIPKNRTLVLKTISLVNKLNTIPYYKLHCNIEEVSALIAYQTLSCKK